MLFLSLQTYKHPKALFLFRAYPLSVPPAVGGAIRFFHGRLPLERVGGPETRDMFFAGSTAARRGFRGGCAPSNPSTV